MKNSDNFFKNIFKTDSFKKLSGNPYNIYNLNYSAAAVFAASYADNQERAVSLFVLPEEKFIDRFLFETQGIFNGLVPLPIVNSEKYSNFVMDSLIKLNSEKEKNTIVLTVPQSFDLKYPSKKNIDAHSLILKKHDEYGVSTILEFLEKNGFERADITREKNYYSNRGGIIDIFPEYSSKPFRLDFFGDALTSIRLFDENSQRSINEQETLILFPKLENIENSENLESYFEPGTPLFVYEPVLCKKNYESDFDGLLNKFSNGSRFYLTLLGDAGYENSIPLNVDSNIIFNANNTLAVLNYSLNSKKKVILTANYDSQINRLTNILETNKLKFKISDFNNIDLSFKDSIFIIKSNIIEPFEFISNNCLILPESSVSSGRHIKNKSHLIEYETIPYHSFSELNENDYIVHIDYGIGIYRKIETIEIDGKNQDFILIQYADDGQLFLPVEHLHKIQKYIGDSESSPVLYKLGGSAWQKVKLKAKKEIGRIAAELVELYARREIKTGIKFLKDTPWQLEFEEEFSWEETRDQLKVIDEVKKDMESEKVMDRLVCGDVGYGKTEIAVRAVFKSAASGYQSAALVPTTILASQHYNTFKDRFANYPFKVEELSRFKSKSEQKSIIKKLESGEIDVIIGTHRLLQKDIKFRKIGLLVIDEEQRFGVKHKEKIKQMKSNIDVLSMTATPIPRTLHMSLMGARDISVITTPPKGRIPIEVITAEDTDDIIKEAVTNELKRNGQIYFIHNRIDNIRNVEARLNRIIPEAKIAVIHGRLEPEQIEDAMIDFIEKKYDILLSTTIIENGLDIPNVNTLIITEADKFGLAQMYQIKGRIGRTNVQAYSYFLHKGQHSISDIAKKRLSMIAQHKELGAGFKIAMNDLEIRGAGNIIGTEQHGIIVDIGYELYCKLLAEMIKYLQKHNKLQDDFNVLDREIIIETKKSCYIPDDYISDSKTKIEIYKKLSVCYDENSLSVITGEIIDRFGRLPEPVSNLIEAVDLKIFAFNNNIEKILFKNDFIEIVFVSKDEILKLKKTSSLNITFAGEKILHLKIKKNQDTSELFDNLKKVLKLAARIPDNKDLI